MYTAYHSTHRLPFHSCLKLGLILQISCLTVSRLWYFEALREGLKLSPQDQLLYLTWLGTSLDV